MMMKRGVLLCFFILFGVLNTYSQSDSLSYGCFNNTSLRVILPSNYVFSGDKIEAEILLVQNDSNSKAEASIKGWKTIPLKNGQARYTTIAFGEGKQTIEGYVNYFVGDKYKRLPFKQEYTVYKAAANVSAVRMNVLYVGIENPITVTVPGYSTNKITVSMANGELIKVKDNNYIAKVYKGKEARISVALKTDGGKTKSLGSYTYRILNAPKLYPILGSLQNGTYVDSSELVAKLKTARRLELTTGASFPFSGLNFKIGNYTVSILKANGASPSPLNFSGEVLSAQFFDFISGIESGDKIIIDNIKVAAPDDAWDTVPFVISVK